MSSMLRPVGHLPASVYWFRRGLLLVALVVVLVLFGRLIGGGGDKPENTAAGSPQQGETPAAPVDPTSTPSTDEQTPAKTPPPTGKPTGKPTDKPNTPETPKTPEAPEACAGRDVRVNVLPAVRSIKDGGSLNFAIQLSAVRGECKAAIDPTLLSLTITSGADQIWSTTQCEQTVPRATFLVAKGKQSTSTVAWDGRRSGPGCLPGQPVAKPGTYVAKAVYDGQASAAQAFYIVAS
ncbi:hypothetical protein [Kribbella italica]|uniref:Uncharacterized protein n=1 Tax=Kribbella italica TaxID=1540520 RepID=A0A7W9JAC1_9ACTN|nr:hypothetical protein [Kribbella italica]MBB5838526.1 hypothetical protein [Kribbella italica]